MNPINAKVLVLNRNWQAINICGAMKALCEMYADEVTALDISDENLVPCKWDDWVKLPIRPGDDVIKTARGEIRMPTVIVLASYAKVPMRAPKFSASGIWERDGGTCQYTGRKLKRKEGNVDHVIPVSRGGASNWENCVLSAKEINSMKEARTPEEAGLKLIRRPAAPKLRPAVADIRPEHPSWEKFLVVRDN